MKKLINLLLLTVMSFSIAHGVVKEYVSEFDHAIKHHD